MKSLIAGLLLATGLFQCGEDVNITKCFAEPCSIEATVRDLTGLDGCGLVFELNDGTRLIPERRTYVQAPQPEEDPIFYYEMIPGNKVLIGFEESSAASVCMAGKVVFVTCIEPTGQPVD
jgi:hypothetical protein